MAVPYFSQLGNSPNNDCGPADAYMLASAVGKVGTHTITDWSKRFDPTDDGTTAAQVRAMLAECGLATLTGYSANYPYIALVTYAKLPENNRWQAKVDFAHWIVRLSDTTYHDPYWPGTQGANLHAEKAVLDAAEISATARTGLAIKIPDAPLTSRTTRVFLRLRSTPTTDIASNIIGDIAKGVVIKPIEAVDDAAGRGRWLRVKMPVPDMVRDENETIQYAVEGWVAEWLTDPLPVATPTPTPTPTPVPVTPPPAAPVPSFTIGWNCLQNTGMAMGEADRGCGSFLIMNDFMGASQLKQAHPKAVVMARRWWPAGSPSSVDQMLQGLEGGNNAGLVYIGANEADTVGQGGSEIDRRVSLDVGTATEIKKRTGGKLVNGKWVGGGTYAAGTFSVGCPNFLDPDVIKRMKAYAPHYNSGLIAFDMHLYSPDMAHIYKPAERIWFERRWEFLFTDCDFDPTIRALYCSETGVDEGNVGGFRAHGATLEAFTNWWKAFYAVQTAPLVVKGVSYPSPMIAANIFQLGGNGDARWAGYDGTNYLEAARKLY